MNENDKLAVLIREIEQGLAVLTKNEDFLAGFMEHEYKLLGRSQTSAIVVAETITNYYTCAETIFLRISRFFENALQKDKWHTDLLHKMTLDIEGIRPAAITHQTFTTLIELMRFRHFKRYYFEFEYDWDKLDFLLKKYEQVKPLLRHDLQDFVTSLRKVHNNNGKHNKT
jgi:hypothetical protein